MSINILSYIAAEWSLEPNCYQYLLLFIFYCGIQSLRHFIAVILNDFVHTWGKCVL